MNDNQIKYWNQEGATKTFSHLVNESWLKQYIEPASRILDYGCGYGRITAQLSEQGYDVVGIDPAEAMIKRAQNLYPGWPFEINTSLETPFDNESFDAAILFAVLTCIPSNEEQVAVVNELYRIVRPGGLLYVSDYWLQPDERNRSRYAQYESQDRTYGVFEVSKGVAVRHHSREWITELLCRWTPIASTDIQVMTMNGHKADGFQWLCRKPFDE